MDRNELRKLIIKELKKAVYEDALVDPEGDDYRRNFSAYDKFNEKDVCEQCGSHNMYEKECMECGYMNENPDVLEEGNYGDCGCASNCDCRKIDDGTDYSIDTMLKVHDHPENKKHHNNNYMAKPALYKVAKYAYKLLCMIPDGYELDDWQRTKIAQISDDISEVYHSLDYDFHDDEC